MTPGESADRGGRGDGGLARFDEAARRQRAAERSRIPTALTRERDHLPVYVNPAFVQRFGAATLPEALPDLLSIMGADAAFAAGLDEVFAAATTACVALGAPAAVIVVVAPILDARGTVTGLVIQVIGDAPARSEPPEPSDPSEPVSIGRTPTEEPGLVAINERLLIASIRELEVAETARQRADKLQALLAAMTEGVSVFAANTEVMLTNACGCAMLGLPTMEADLDDYRACDLRGLDGAPLDFDRDVLAGLLAGAVAERELAVSDRRIVYSGGVVRGPGGEVDLSIMIYRDVTALRDLERAREQYLALLSHDLRGPLSVASMSAELMAMHAPGVPAIAALAAKVVKQLALADGMIRDLLDMQRLQAGTVIAVHPVACDLVEIARSVVADLALIHGDRVRLAGVARHPGIYGENEIRRAVWNLATNALKYGAPMTPITVTVSVADDVAQISVHNEGPPIPVTARDLFAPFQRGPATDAQPPGWGLGLAVVKACAEAHGGRVDLTSDVARGTTFTLELPAELPTAGL